MLKLLALVPLLALAGCSLIPENTRDEAHNHDFAVHVPEDHDPNQPLPVIVAYHGLGGDAEQFRAATGLDKAKAITVFLNGESNAWSPAPYADSTVEEDLEYTDHVMEIIRSRFEVTDFYAAGWSNGGGFTQLLSCQRADQFAGFASVAAAYYEGVSDSCATAPVPRMSIHGTQDSTIAYEGGRKYNTAFAGAREVMEGFAQRNQCTGREVSHQDRLETTMWTGCQAPTEHITVRGGEHPWPAWATDEILDFFEIEYP